MYQSHYSYFPYQRNIVQQDNKQGIIDNEGISDTSQETHNNRESPNNISTTNTTTTAAHQYQNSGFERNNFSRHNSGAAAAYNQHQQQESPYSPQHNNNLTGTFPSRGDTSTREGQSLPPLLRVGDKLAAAHVSSHVSQVVKGERDGDVGEEEQRSAQYLSANCVIFTYYTGDISKLVDEHFTKALSQSSDRDHVPLSARNLPPSFWDCNWVGSPSSDLTSAQYGGDHAHWPSPASSDPWHNYMAAQMAVTGGSYSAHHMYHNARSYSSLLLHSRREWVEQNYSSSPYSSMTGLEGGMQGSAKDLYWF